MPLFRDGAGGSGSGNPRLLLLRGKLDNRRRVASRLFVLAGVTRDANGTPLPGCTVDLFTTADNVFVATTVSDSGGNYSFAIGTAANYYCVAYLAGSPDVSGTTLNTLVGV